MARLNLNNSSSVTEEHRQAGYLPLPSGWENNNCYRSSEQGESFIFLDGQKKTWDGGGGEIHEPALEGWMRFL